MGDNMGDDILTVIEFDLNQEDDDLTVVEIDLNHPPPVGSVLGLGSLLNQLETAHGRIEERIRQLEAVTARARQRQMWQQPRNLPETSNIPVEPVVNVGGESGVHNGVGIAEGTDERGKSCIKDSTLLVAKALKMDMDVKGGATGGGSFFDCNICLDMARDPILTCCGHLFCWACFYRLPYVDSSAKECPVCKGEVMDASITPIYGHGNHNGVLDTETESGLNIPPRPRARRIESVRQQRVNRGISHIPVAEALRRIRNGIGAMGEHPRELDLNSVNVNSDATSRVDLNSVSIISDTTSHLLPNAGAGGSRRVRSRQFSRVLSESAASLSSVSSALNNAERVDGDLETFIHDRLMGRNHSQFLPVDGGDSFTSNAAIIQSEQQTVDSTAEINSGVPLSSSSRRIDVNDVVRVETLRTDTVVAINLGLTPHPASSSNSRSGASRGSDADNGESRNGASRDSRRRRLR